MNRRRRSRFRSSMNSDVTSRSPSPDYDSEIPRDLFHQSLTILDVDRVHISSPVPPTFSPDSPLGLRGESLVTTMLRSLPQSPELPSARSSTPDLRAICPPSHMIMESPVPSVAGSPSWMRLLPSNDTRIRHSIYYLEDGIIFLAENTLFKVPRYMLNQESEDFRRLYSDQFEQEGKGYSDTDPIVLDGVEAADFQQLLMVLYPRSIPVAASATERWTEMEWESVLRLSAMWRMPQVRLLAIEKMSSCASSMTKILLGKRYDIPRWIRAGFLDLCLRDGPLTEDEGSRLDWKDMLKISHAREIIRFKVINVTRHQEWESTRYGNCSVYRTSYDPAGYTKNMMVHHILDEIFGLEDLASGINSRPSSPSSPVSPTPLEW